MGSMSDQTLPERAASALVRESTAVVVFAILAFPGFVLLSLLIPNSVGFYLIAVVGAAGHVVLRRMSERDRSVETDFSEVGGKQAVGFLLVLAAVGSVTVSVRLGVGVIAGEIITAFVGKSLLTILGAAITPMFDYLLGERYWLLSPSAVAALGVIKLLAAISESIDSDTAESIRADARRVDPM